MEKNNKKTANVVDEKLTSFSLMPAPEVFRHFNVNNDGLDAEKIEEGREKYGPNIISTGKQDSVLTRIRDALINPFNVVLLLVG